MAELLQDAANSIINILQSIKGDSSNNIVNIYFCEKRTPEYRSYAPQISNEMQNNILELVIPPLVKVLELPVVQYNPTGVLDEQNELIDSANVGKVKFFINSLNDDKLIKDMSLINSRNISFYVIEITYRGEKIFFFRKFTKMNLLRKGIIGQLFDNELKKIDNNFLGIDELTDMVLFRDNLLIINHISLERVFDYRDIFQELTHQAIGRIAKEGKMTNIEKFTEDCLNDVRIMKRFTDLMSNDRLPLFFENYDRVPEIVTKLSLDIEFEKDGRMIYRDKSQLFHIIHLMSDAYFKSLIAERIGVAEMEGKI